jgi:N-acyl-D-amino-acid deacylase
MARDLLYSTGVSAGVPKLLLVRSSSSRFARLGRRRWFAAVHFLLAVSAAGLLAPATAGNLAPAYDVIIRNGELFDGSGGKSRIADIAVRSDRIVAIADRIPGSAKVEIDARGKAVAPGFINMLAHPEESLIADGRALSDLRQGITLEVLGEESMGPVSARMKAQMPGRQADIKYPIGWNTLGEYLEMLERKGIAPNIASFVGAGTVRNYVLSEEDVQPTPRQLSEMRRLVRKAMEDGLTTALIYSPNTYAKTPELIALAKVSARCGGLYTAHIRNEGDRLEAAVQETFDIAEASGAPAEIYHFKQAGRENWGKFDVVVRMINAERAKGVRITADMYTYTAAATGLNAAMPPWVQAGGLEAWVARLKDPAIRAGIVSEMRDPHPNNWENVLAGAGAEGTLLLAFKNPALKPLAGKTLAEVARMRGKSPQETAVDLVIEDGSRVGVAYSLMSEENVRRAIALPWMSFGSDEAAPAPEGVFLLAQSHPRAYGNFARLLGRYVRDQKVISLTEAIRRLTSLPADNLSLKDRGRLEPGYFADIVIFDPKSISDHATFADAAQLAMGVEHVLINGAFALRSGKPAGEATGRVVRGRAWNGAPGGGCRRSPSDWTWSK